MAICTANDVRTLTDLTTDDITDNKLDEVIAYAWQQVQSDIGVRVEEEEVEWIDTYRQNDIDGANTTFYVKRSFPGYIGDLDGDQTSLDSTDVEVWLYNSTTQARSSGTISTVNSNGYWTMTTAPAGNNDMTVTYISLPLPMTHFLLKKATVELSAALCYSKLDARGVKSIRLGRLAVDKTMTTSSFDRLYAQYKRTLDQINAKSLMMKQVDSVKIPELEVLVEAPNAGGSER